MTIFNKNLNEVDHDVYQAIQGELGRQQNWIELIASENIVSRAVLEAQGCVMTNKYAEGYPGKRYYGGGEHVDVVEQLAINRACKLFNANFANVQPHAGSQTNQIIFNAFLQPGDKILGMRLADGGHLTHGHHVNFSGKWYDVSFYGVDEETGCIDYDSLAEIAATEKPKLITIGASAYPRTIDFARMREIADDVGAYLLADVAHIAGLIVAGEHPNPLPHADFVTTTTHKTLRGPRGGMILWNKEEYTKPINSSLFPGMQGGPLMHQIAAKAVALKEAMQPEFKVYAKQVITNTKTMGEVLSSRGWRLLSGGTDNHLLLMDVFCKGVTGKQAQEILGEAGLTLNMNMIPYDTRKPMNPSGVRLGAAAGTTRGFKEAEFTQIAHWISDVLDAIAEDNAVEETVQRVRQEVQVLCDKFPIYQSEICAKAA
ncbi:MAG: serine hydroxymethyltransferase [Alphaproteobacteria bacterium]|nr:serine hydroxymethyltransferase [Alphaproteobacteria bacterium]MDD9920419.1 serine hydroxymethyltransferase [Alphaproteobacteria bacterium]